MKLKVNEELKQHFRPEFLNRIDDIVVFHQLTEDEIVQIVDLMVARVETQLANKDMALEITPAAKKLLGAPRVRPGAGCPAAASHHPARDRGRAVGEDPLRRDRPPGRSSWSTSTTPRARRRQFTFRGEAKPIDVPDTPPVALSGADGDDEDGPRPPRPT